MADIHEINAGCKEGASKFNVAGYHANNAANILTEHPLQQLAELLGQAAVLANEHSDRISRAGSGVSASANDAQSGLTILTRSTEGSNRPDVTDLLATAREVTESSRTAAAGTAGLDGTAGKLIQLILQAQVELTTLSEQTNFQARSLSEVAQQQYAVRDQAEEVGGSW